MERHCVSRYIKIFPIRAMRYGCSVRKKEKKKMERIVGASSPPSDLGPSAPAFFGAFNHIPSQHSGIVVRPEAIAENMVLDI